MMNGERKTKRAMESKRIASWWITWRDLQWPDPDNLDRIRARADALAEAGATSAMIFGTHFRWDYLPIFTLLHDYLATVAEELHSRGLELYDHHSVNLIHRYDTKEEMRHVMLHSGPHLPLSPSREAAKTWEYGGRRLNDWRMIDVKTRQVLYFPQYAAEGFCTRNPEFIEAYLDYVRQLIADTGIDGLSADDPIHYMNFSSCACPHCRAELKRRAGIDLPPIEDQTFWGNWDSPAWKAWCDLRLDSTGEFCSRLAGVLPEGFELMSCGASSARPHTLGNATDARQFLRGCTRVNLEMAGNTPPYRDDPATINIPIIDRLVNSSHHQAAGRETGARCFGTGYGFTEQTADLVWAVNKVLDSDCWFSELRGRLGLPDHILDTLPEEGEIVGHAFRFEKAHSDLFRGEQIGQLAVYFSYETRNHTMFGSLTQGYYQDYHDTLLQLFRAGMSPHTIFGFPRDASQYPLVLLPSALAMTEAERSAMDAYLAAGGRVVATGPCALAECRSGWHFPSRPDCAPQDFFSAPKPPEWSTRPLPPGTEPDVWSQPIPGLYYDPCRMGEGKITSAVLDLCRRYAKPLPVRVLDAAGYLITVFADGDHVTVHLLAEEYDTDIDHRLDEMRFHRSRVNLITKVAPVGVTRTIRAAADRLPQVYLPLNDGAQARAELADGVCTVTLPEDCAYVLLHF